MLAFDQVIARYERRLKCLRELSQLFQEDSEFLEDLGTAMLPAPLVKDRLEPLSMHPLSPDDACHQVGRLSK